MFVSDNTPIPYGSLKGQPHKSFKLPENYFKARWAVDQCSSDDVGLQMAWEKIRKNYPETIKWIIDNIPLIEKKNRRGKYTHKCIGADFIRPEWNVVHFCTSGQKYISNDEKKFLYRCPACVNLHKSYKAKYNKLKDNGLFDSFHDVLEPASFVNPVCEYYGITEKDPEYDKNWGLYYTLGVSQVET